MPGTTSPLGVQRSKARHQKATELSSEVRPRFLKEGEMKGF